MRDNPKVVSIERNAAYLHHRAMMNRRENHIVDALELMRSAVEASPENREYRLDLAELYCEMGCHAQSSRLLLDILSDVDAPSECYYGLALNQLGMNDVAGARHSLEMYRHRDPEGAHIEDAGQLAGELDLYNSMNRPASRRLYRAMRVADRACDCMKAEQPERACRMFKRTLEIAPEQPEMRALYAMALMMADRRAEARQQAQRAAEAYPPSVRVMCVCAQVYAMLGEAGKAEALMRAAERENPSGQELRLMLFSAGEIGMNALAAECARRALQETPYERELLHIRAVALKRSGAGDEEARRCWERILRLDPEDSVAGYYESVAAKGALDTIELDYNYQVPDAEYARRMKRFSEYLSDDFDRLKAIWEADGDFRRLVRWAACTGDERLGRAAVAALAAVENPEADSVLREVMFAPDVSKDLKLHTALLLRLQGRALDRILPEPVSSGGSALVDYDGLMEAMPVGERQLVRYASEVLEREYDLCADTALALMWSNYRRLRGTRGDPLKRVESASAGLAYNYLLASGAKPSARKLARQFGCGVRQLVFCAARIAGCIDRAGGNE